MKQRLPKLYGRVLCAVRVAVASLLGALTAFGLNGAVLAAGTCMEGPNLNSGQGLRWYYRVDRINHRKCWYVTETGLKTNALGVSPPGAASTSMQPSVTKESRVPPAPPRETMKVVQAIPNERSRPARSTLAGMRRSATKESQLPPATPRRTVKIVHAVPDERSRPARPPEAKGAATAERNQPSPSRSSAGDAEQVNSQPPDQAARDALFLEFLRWKELQKSAK